MWVSCVDLRGVDLRGVEHAIEVTAASLGVQALAHQSGGQILMGAKNIPSGISACMADAKSYYELTFDSPPAGANFH